MDHKAFVAGLDPTQREWLTRRDNGPGLLHLGLHLGLILAFGVVIMSGVTGWWLLLLPQGILLAFLFTLQHEATHKTPFASERLNEWVGHFCGLVILQPFQWFRYFHLAHHRHTHDRDHDPELTETTPKTRRQFLWHLSTIGYWWAKRGLLWRNAFGEIDDEFVPNRARQRIALEARLLLAAYTSAAVFTVTVSSILLWVWLVPLALGFPLLRLYLLAEHKRCPHVSNMFENTRTTFTNRVIRFVAWNMPYHTEHHVFPQVPFYNLPAFHTLVAAHLRHTARGYGAFTRQYVEGLKAHEN